MNFFNMYNGFLMLPLFTGINNLISRILTITMIEHRIINSMPLKGPILRHFIKRFIDERLVLDILKKNVCPAV